MVSKLHAPRWRKCNNVIAKTILDRVPGQSLAYAAPDRRICSEIIAADATSCAAEHLLGVKSQLKQGRTVGVPFDDERLRMKVLIVAAMLVCGFTLNAYGGDKYVRK